MILGIIGLGLMGGSFALSCKQNYNFTKIVGVDHNKKHAQTALKLNLVDEIIEFDELHKCDVIIVSVPICAIICILKDLSKMNLKKNVTIIDFGSTKEEIIKKCPENIRKNFVPSHPMAGTEYSGPEAALPNLFENKVMVVCNIEDSGKYQVNLALDIYKSIKMNIKIMDAHEHDRHAAFISHMPHIVSYSLTNSVLKQEDKDHIVTLAAGGFRSMARLAKSNPAMWKDIFESNEKNLLDAIDAFKKELEIAQELIEKKEYDKLYEWMEKGNKLHEIL
jgi:prephenate dehydrogenase